MANIFLRGKNEPYGLSETDAKDIKEIWKDNSYPPNHKIDLGPISFEKRDIKLIEIADEKKGDRWEWDIDNPEWRAKVRKFETEWLAFLETVEKKYKTFQCFAWMQRAITCSGEPLITSRGTAIWENWYFYQTP